MNEFHTRDPITKFDGCSSPTPGTLIQKTPRVRIREDYMGRETHGERNTRLWGEYLDWCEGSKGYGPDDERARGESIPDIIASSPSTIDLDFREKNVWENGWNAAVIKGLEDGSR